MELNKLCRTCLSASEDLTSLYEACATSTPVCCAEMLSTFTPLICFKDDGLSTMICHDCIREVNRCHTFRLKCLESDRVLRKHVPRVIGVAPTNITVTNEQTESRNQGSIKLEADMDEDSRIFEEVSFENELSTSSKNEISAKSLKGPLSLTDMQVVMDEELDIVKHEIDIKIEKDKDINIEVNNTLVNEQESKKAYTCAHCNKSFKLKRYLYVHMRLHTGEKPYLCTVCNNAFKQKQTLTNHMRTHTGEKPYLCTVCDSSFRVKDSLTCHMLTHTGDKPYTCSVCNISIRHKSAFTIHTRTHTGERPYSCTVCDRSFKSKKLLTSHMWTHTDVKACKCPVCNISYGDKTKLKIHMRTHTGEKPYSCTMCASSFKQMSHLSTHMRTHTGVKPYPCTVCDSSFKAKRTLIKHKKKHTEKKS